jgi:antitoxin MazE
MNVSRLIGRGTRTCDGGAKTGATLTGFLLEQSGLGEEVELEVQDAQIVIRPAERPRHAWEDAFQSMAEHADDQLVDQDCTGHTDWDKDEWQW